jgi:hypothetical protein
MLWIPMFHSLLYLGIDCPVGYPGRYYGVDIGTSGSRATAAAEDPSVGSAILTQH